MTEELWRPVPGWPDYTVSSLGRVVSQNGWRGVPGPRELAGQLALGYPAVTLTAGSHKRYVPVHRLVAEAFLGPCPEDAYDRVRHGTHHQMVKTQCKNGHPFDQGNTIIRKGGAGRDCRICRRDRQLRHRPLVATSRPVRP